MKPWKTATAVALLGAACAGAPPVPPERLAGVESEIRAAQEIGANNVPQAKLHLQNATDQLKAAQAIKDPEEAGRKLDNAKAEAELANALTREQVAKNEAQQAKARLAATQQGKPVTTGGAQ
jgi:ribosomal protein L7/L12